MDSLTDFLSKLLIQVRQINALDLLGMIDINPIELDDEASFLVISSDPHRMYQFRHDGEQWKADDAEDCESVYLVSLLNKLNKKPKYNTEIWAVKYLSSLGYRVTKNSKVVAIRGELTEDFL